MLDCAARQADSTSMPGWSRREAAGADPVPATVPPAFRSIGRVVRAALLVVGLTVIFLIPTFLTHIGLGLVAPISSGYMAGRLRKLSGGEAFSVAIILGLCAGLPVPIAQREFGFLPYLSAPAVIFLSAVVAIYYGVLVGIAAWYGGHLARTEGGEFDGLEE